MCENTFVWGFAFLMVLPSCQPFAPLIYSLLRGIVHILQAGVGVCVCARTCIYDQQRCVLDTATDELRHF